jgi:hypothetical protein
MDGVAPQPHSRWSRQARRPELDDSEHLVRWPQIGSMESKQPADVSAGAQPCSQTVPECGTAVLPSIERCRPLPCYRRLVRRVCEVVESLTGRYPAIASRAELLHFSPSVIRGDLERWMALSRALEPIECPMRVLVTSLRQATYRRHECDAAARKHTHRRRKLMC